MTTRMPAASSALPVLTLLLLVALPVRGAQAASPDVVISQVYGGGGNSGAILRQDFIELFNRGTAAVTLTGWSVQYASASGTTWQRTNLSGTLQPGQYYLIQQATGTGGVVNLPTPDATGAISMSATSGKVALVINQTLLTCGGGFSCIPNASIIDFVGYGSSADDFEGAGPTGTLSNTTAALRRNGGCTDTDYNAADFEVGAPDPRNTASPLRSCADPSCSFSFTPIYAIQGSGPAAAITGNVTTQGVVIGDFEGSTGLGGFYLQDLTGDADPATSDGIFVFTGSANTASVGQVVRVTGFARERFGQTTLNGSNSNTSAVPAANIVNCGSASVAPTDVTLPFPDVNYLERFEGMLVRLPQALVISDYFNLDRFGEVVLALPRTGESRLLAPTSVVEPGPAALAHALDNTLRRLLLDDGLGIQNPSVVRHPNGNPVTLANRLRGGDTVQNTVGVLGFDFDAYRIQPTAPAQYTSLNQRPAAPDPVGGNVRVAAVSTNNFFLTLDDPLGAMCGPAQNLSCRGADANQPDEFTRQRDKLVAALAGLDADIVGLIELENTTGVDPLGDPTKGLVAGLNGLLGTGTYARVDTGVIGSDAVRVGLIYRPAAVVPVGTFATLDSSVDPRFNDAKNRPALAQTFVALETGSAFTVVVNHLKSKGAACNDVGDPDQGDGQGNCNLTRRDAAQALVDWLATDPTGSGDPDYLILGDLNAFAKEHPIDAIRAGADDTLGTSDDYIDLIARHQGPHAYSFVFDGQAGYLDHALASASLAGQVTGATHWHINADEPDLFDYDTSFKPASQDALYEPNAYRSSDHDPVVVGLTFLYDFTGFFPPVSNPPTFNVVKAGSAVPAKFSLGGDQGLDIFAAGYPRSEKIPCASNDPVNGVDETVTAGSSSLSYDAATDTYTYVWKTNRSWARTCRQLVVQLNDGTSHRANFSFSK